MESNEGILDAEIFSIKPKFGTRFNTLLSLSANKLSKVTKADHELESMTNKYSISKSAENEPLIGLDVTCLLWGKWGDLVINVNVPSPLSNASIGVIHAPSSAISRWVG